MLAFLLAMVLFQPAKAMKLEKAHFITKPVKAAVLLFCLFQPAKAPPPYGRPYCPWWRVRFYDRQMLLCYPDGSWRLLTDEEGDEVEDWMDDSEGVEDYINSQSRLCEAYASFAVPFGAPVWDQAWRGYRFPGYDNPGVTIMKIGATGSGGQRDSSRQRESNASSSAQACKGSSGPEPAKAKGKGKSEPAKAKGKGKSEPAKAKGKGKSEAADSRGKGKGKPGKADEGPRRRTTGDPRRRANKGPDTLGCLTRIKRNAARALKQAGLPVPKNLRPGKTLQDLEPAKAEEAKQLQRKLKELTWTDSMSARKMQTEIYWTKERLKQLFAPDDEEKDPDELEEVPADEEEEEDEEESSSSSSDDKLAKAQLKAAQEELAKAKQELAKAKEAKEKKKEKKKAKIEQEEKQQDEEMPQAVEQPEKADGVKVEPAKADEAEPEKAEAEPEKADEDELPDYDPDEGEESLTEAGSKKKKKRKRAMVGKRTKMTTSSHHLALKATRTVKPQLPKLEKAIDPTKSEKIASAVPKPAKATDQA